MILRMEPVTMAVVAFVIFVVLIAGGIYVDEKRNSPENKSVESSKSSISEGR